MDANAYIQGFLAEYQHYKPYWNYEDGCVLKGCADLWRATSKAGYRRFILDYLADEVSPDGEILHYETQQYNIDSVNSGKALFFGWHETSEERYRKAIEYQMQRLREHPRCDCGSFWHKTIYPWQIWLDGLYMAVPFYAQYERELDDWKQIGDVVRQFENVRARLYCAENRLYYHACDEKRAQPWANPQTGCSPNFWLRSIGWWLMAMVDTIELLPEELYDKRRAVEDIFREAVRGLMPYADAKTGLFYQVVDHPEAKGNYLETSGSAMAGYALLKGCRIGTLNAEKYRAEGLRIVRALAENKLRKDDAGSLHLTDICAVAGLGPGEKRDGSVAYYLSEPIVSDDAKGVGPFMMAWSEYLLAQKEEK